jgi:hypothetical protein
MRRRRKPDALAVLNAAWQAGEMTEKEYDREFADLNSRHGKRCACGGQIAYTHTDGRQLCGDCALWELRPSCDIRPAFGNYIWTTHLVQTTLRAAHLPGKLLEFSAAAEKCVTYGELLRIVARFVKLPEGVTGKAVSAGTISVEG